MREFENSTMTETKLDSFILLYFHVLYQDVTVFIFNPQEQMLEKLL